MTGKAIRIRGVVQGVGFRPFIWRLAGQFRLTGEVWNDGLGVMIHAFGTEDDLAAFIRQIPLQLPPLARLDSLAEEGLEEYSVSSGFRIAESRNNGSNTVVAADSASCPECLSEIHDPDNRRYRYPFTTCTHCGPRLSIIREVPFDRGHTSMAGFTMCSSCQAEYDNPSDRRFHAEATCCPICGPKVWLEDDEGQRIACADSLRFAADLIREGYILAVKGLGGFHLACNATNASAVDRLREGKHRYAKPFALMGRDVGMIADYARLNEEEIRALKDKAAPIVLLTSKGKALAPGVAPDSDTLGFMLPYTPLHSLLLENLDFPVVMTSGNISDEPQCTNNDEARLKLSGIADYLLLHDRDIVNRLDDSVVRLMGDKICLLRRARGFCPESLPLPEGLSSASSVLAMGGELKNSFCLIKNGEAVVGQHMGDLENAAVQADYREAISLYQHFYDFHPGLVVVDSHPGYLSTQYGHELALSLSIEVSPVQHHHAHLAACLAEHGIGPDAPPVLGAIFDGLGFGDDGTLWGGEFLLGDYRDFRRLGHFQPIALPGGSQAMREPWRNSFAQLFFYFDWLKLEYQFADLECIRTLNSKPLTTVAAMMVQKINSPLSSSCGRWFDAFAAVLGLHQDAVFFEGQAAIALETLATPVFFGETFYADAFEIAGTDGPLILSWRGLWQAVLADLTLGTDQARIAARIHHSLVAGSFAMLNRLSLETGTDTIVLSGGVFQNRLLLESLTHQLELQGKRVLSPVRYPMNDGGLALGQAVIGAARQV